MKNLAIFLTYNTSLESWKKNGTFDRELSIYKRFLNHFDKIYLVTYGDDDSKLADSLPENIIILPKKVAVNNFLYSLLIPFIYRKELRNSDWFRTNQALGSWSAVFAKILFGKKLNFHTGYTESLSYINKSFIDKILIIIIEFFAYKSATISTVTSEYQKEYATEKYAPKKIFVIPNGIDTKIFKPCKRDRSEKINLFLVARLHPEKNILNLLEALKDLKNVSLKIVGRGPLEKGILEFKKKYDLDLEIVPSIPNSKISEAYNSTDIYIQPSIYEGNPKTILEAMSCGLPVIATDIKGMRGVIMHNESGYLCKTDSQSIKEALLEIIENTKLREKIGSGARKTIEEKYDLDEIVRKEIKIYRDNE